MKIDTFVQDRLQLVKISNASTFFTSVPTSSLKNVSDSKIVEIQKECPLP